MAKLHDLTGQRFGQLTVIDRAENHYTAGGNSKAMWRCRCECGEECIVESQKLKSMKITQCKKCNPQYRDVDLTGQKFGRWTVLRKAQDKANSRGNMIKMWTCQCECGTIKDVIERNLINRSSTSCGCYRTEKNCEARHDLVGQKFGRLTVISRGESTRRKSGVSQIMWHCLCDCGNEIDVRAGSIKSGNTTSCGCYDQERRRKYCLYDLESTEYGIGYTQNNDVFIFDKEDYELIKDYCWNKSARGYFEACTRIDGKKTKIGLHRLVMGITDNTLYVDHIGHNKWDNRKSQLRIVTNSQNQMNRNCPSNNSSGIKGVYWKRGKWESGIRYQDKYIYLGRFDSKEDAIMARQEAEEKYFGEWSYKNSQKLVKEK